jgi:hypothetical protein
MQLVRHVDSSIAMFENVVRPLRHPLGIVCCCLVVHTISAVILMPSIKIKLKKINSSKYCIMAFYGK